MTISWIRIETEFCSSCWLMLRSVLSSALTAKSTSCATARNTIIPTTVNSRCGIHCTPSPDSTSRSGRFEALITMPCVTALVSSRVIPTEIVGMRPASAVVMKRPIVVGLLASQTSRMTCGKAAVVPVIDCLKFSQRPRRSFGPSGSCGGSIVGSPVRPLLAGPVSGLRRRPPQPPHQITGPCEPGGIIPMGSGLYHGFPNRLLQCNCVITSIDDMDEKELGSIKGWFAGRLPDGWFSGAEVTVEDDQIVVVGALSEKDLPATSSAEEKEGAAAGRIARFREETRGERIGIAREAEERFHKYVTWGAKLGGVTKRFNPGGGGGGRSGGGRVMIGRWWRRRHGHGAQSPAQPSSTSQVF